MVLGAEGDTAKLAARASQCKCPIYLAQDRPGEKGFPGATFERYNAKDAPALFLIDKAGAVQYQHLPQDALIKAVELLTNNTGGQDQ